MKFWNIFFFYSLLGHLMESLIFPNGESGIFYGPWTPIYGLGVLFILFLYFLLKKKVNSKFLLMISLFFLSGILLSILEWCGGTLIELFFHKTFWNYSSLPFSIGKYASIEMAFIWGVGSILITFLIHPIIEKIFVKIPRLVSYLLIIFFFTDVLLSILFKAKFL